MLVRSSKIQEEFGGFDSYCWRFRRREAQTWPMENYATDSSDFRRIRGIEQGSEAARIQLRRANGRVCVHAGGRIGE